MPTSFTAETELPGKKVNKDNIQIIAHRYLWAAQYVSDKVVLEIGCGPGLGLGYLSTPAKKVIGGDITWGSLNLASKHYGDKIALAQLDAHKLPFKDNSFDVLVCVASVIYFDFSSLVKECFRTLRAGGVLLLNTPNKDIPGFKPSVLSREYHSVPQLFSTLSSCGFSVETFGAFPAENQAPKVLWRQKISPFVFLTAKKVTQALGIYNFLDKRVNGILPAELGEKEMTFAKHITSVPLSADTVNRQYRIIYIAASKKSS